MKINCLPLLLTVVLTSIYSPFTSAGEACRTDDQSPFFRDEGATVNGVISSPALKRDDNAKSDLVISPEMASSHVYTEWRYFQSNSCAVHEGCINKTGWRRLLRFYTRIVNQGTDDFELGDPRDPRNQDNVEYDSCHQHYHVKDWANYALLAQDRSTLIQGHKQAFCLMDSFHTTGIRRGKYNCDFQGITAGWADDYSDDLPCQWLDITDVQAGSYTLKLDVNSQKRYPESNYDNNTVEVAVQLKPGKKRP